MNLTYQAAASKSVPLTVGRASVGLGAAMDGETWSVCHRPTAIEGTGSGLGVRTPALAAAAALADPAASADPAAPVVVAARLAAGVAAVSAVQFVVAPAVAVADAAAVQTAIVAVQTG